MCSFSHILFQLASLSPLRLALIFPWTNAFHPLWTLEAKRVVTLRTLRQCFLKKHFYYHHHEASGTKWFRSLVFVCPGTFGFYIVLCWAFLISIIAMTSQEPQLPQEKLDLFKLKCDLILMWKCSRYKKNIYIF